MVADSSEGFLSIRRFFQVETSSLASRPPRRSRAVAIVPPTPIPTLDSDSSSRHATPRAIASARRTTPWSPSGLALRSRVRSCTLPHNAVPTASMTSAWMWLSPSSSVSTWLGRAARARTRQSAPAEPSWLPPRRRQRTLAIWHTQGARVWAPSEPISLPRMSMVCTSAAWSPSAADSTATCLRACAMVSTLASSSRFRLNRSTRPSAPRRGRVMKRWMSPLWIASPLSSPSESRASG
mmetsp:Transcript_13195/g.28395  ORF Transcript_13195/g.28395 Transcript_13195/m.28395 type:complete len:238 (+) Transcript_13195:471-1184(+)